MKIIMVVGRSEKGSQINKCGRITESRTRNIGFILHKKIEDEFVDPLLENCVALINHQSIF